MSAEQPLYQTKQKHKFHHHLHLLWKTKHNDLLTIEDILKYGENDKVFKRVMHDKLFTL